MPRRLSVPRRRCRWCASRFAVRTTHPTQSLCSTACAVDERRGRPTGARVVRPTVRCAWCSVEFERRTPPSSSEQFDKPSCRAAWRRSRGFLGVPARPVRGESALKDALWPQVEPMLRRGRSYSEIARRVGTGWKNVSRWAALEGLEDLNPHRAGRCGATTEP